MLSGEKEMQPEKWMGLKLKIELLYGLGAGKEYGKS